VTPGSPPERRNRLPIISVKISILASERGTYTPSGSFASTVMESGPRRIHLKPGIAPSGLSQLPVLRKFDAPGLGGASLSCCNPLDSIFVAQTSLPADTRTIRVTIQLGWDSAEPQVTSPVPTAHAEGGILPFDLPSCRRRTLPRHQLVVSGHRLLTGSHPCLPITTPGAAAPAPLESPVEPRRANQTASGVP
jgi:hypothetical protein